MMRFSSALWDAQMAAACSAAELTHQGGHTLDLRRGCLASHAMVLP